MININNIALILVTVLAFVLPVLVVIWYKKNTQIKLWPFLCGAVIFIVFAQVLESLLHAVCIGGDNAISGALSSSPILYGIYGGLAAGIFEETGRLFAFKVLLKKYQQKEMAVAYGIGHGGIEVILVLGLTYLLYVLSMIGVNIPNVSAEYILSMGAPIYLIALFERIWAVVLHIALSMMVFVGARKNMLWYFIAIFLHALIDFVAVLAQSGSINMMVLEIIVMIFSIFCFWLGHRVLNNMAGREKSQEESDSQLLGN